MSLIERIPRGPAAFAAITLICFGKPDAAVGQPVSPIIDNPTPTAVFLDLWSEHLEICGEALVDPKMPIASRLRPDWSSTSQFYASNDLSYVTILHTSEQQLRNVDVRGFFVGEVHNLFCGTGYGHFGPQELFSDMGTAAAEVRALIEGTPDLVLSGGPVAAQPGSEGTLLQDAYTLVVAGGFPDFPNSATTVLVTQLGIRLEFHASWRVEE